MSVAVQSRLVEMRVRLGRVLPYPVFALLHSWAREYPRARARDAMMRELALTGWEALDIAAYRKSDTLYILGSGPSINDISEETWRAIRAADSIGFNFWLRHPHVPTLYFFEAVRVRTSLYGNAVWRLDVLRRLGQLMRERALDYAKVPKFIDELHPRERDWTREVPATFRNDLYVARTLSVPARSYGDARNAMRQYLRQGVFRHDGRLTLLPKFGYTVGTLLSVAAHMRYKRIVLCGFDITRGGYFYQDKERYPDMQGFTSSLPIGPHVSALSWGLRCSVKDYILAFRDEILNGLGLSLFVESSTSGLWPEVSCVGDDANRKVVR